MAKITFVDIDPNAAPPKAKIAPPPREPSPEPHEETPPAKPKGKRGFGSKPAKG